MPWSTTPRRHHGPGRVPASLHAAVSRLAPAPQFDELPGARFGGVRMGSAACPETGKLAPGLAGASAWTRASTCTDRGPPGPRPRSCPPQCGAGVRVRCGQPRGISALSTETICGPKLRPPQCPPPRRNDQHHASAVRWLGALGRRYRPCACTLRGRISSTSSTRSPAASSYWASKCPIPSAPSIAQIRSGQAGCDRWRWLRGWVLVRACCPGWLAADLRRGA
jgi:hypothetical protein